MEADPDPDPDPDPESVVEDASDDAEVSCSWPCTAMMARATIKSSRHVDDIIPGEMEEEEGVCSS